MKIFLRTLLVLIFVVIAAAGLSGRLNELLPVDVPTPLTDTTVAVAPVQLLAADNQDANSAIQQVIQHSNDEQVQAIAAGDPSIMADSVTSDHYAELVQIMARPTSRAIATTTAWFWTTVRGRSAPIRTLASRKLAVDQAVEPIRAPTRSHRRRCLSQAFRITRTRPTTGQGTQLLAAPTPQCPARGPCLSSTAQTAHSVLTPPG